MRYAVVTLLVALGAGLAGVGPVVRERLTAPAERERMVRAAAAEPSVVPLSAGQPVANAAQAPAGGDAPNSAADAKETPQERMGESGSPGVAPASTGKDAPADKSGRTSEPATAQGNDDAVTETPELPADAATVKISGAMDSICLILESAASANGLPLEFFARVIWQESRFQPDAVGPVTRSGHRAQGIAQFMPYTAGERGLLDPFNPVAALPKAAEFLKELRSEFGNLGLAAAAYNAGPRRVRDYLAGRGGMPGQTRHYVSVITGRSVDDWVRLRNEGEKDVIAKPTSCRQLAALLSKQPSFFVGELERRVREGKLRPWGVQLSAGFSRARVLEAYARIERLYRGLLESLDPMIIRTVLRSRGTNGFYQVRVGVDTRAAANKLCASLSAKGAACMVLKNSHGAPELLSKRGDEGVAEAKDAKEAKEENPKSKKTR